MLAEHYAAIKALHVAAVAVSIALFALRAGLRIGGSAWLETRVLKVTPHVVDTVLLVSALLLTLIVHQYPFVNGWLTAKLVALVAYVIFGSLAIRRGRTPAVRAVALAAALVSVAYILGTALHHDPDPRRW